MCARLSEAMPLLRKDPKVKIIRIAVAAAGVLFSLTIPALASADPVSCGSDLNGCATQCEQTVGNPMIRLQDCVRTDAGWTCDACEYNSEN